MRRSIRKSFRLFVLLLFFTTVLFIIIFNNVAGNKDDPALIINDLKTVFFVFLALVFLEVLIFWGAFPGIYRSAMNDILWIIKEMSRGNYSETIEFDAIRERTDPAPGHIIEALQRLYSVLSKFDERKTAKIIEHHNRIQCLMKLSADGILIVNMDGYIRYVNDSLVNLFSSIKPDVNLLNAQYEKEAANSVIKFTATVIRTRTWREPENFYIPSLKRHIHVKSCLVRDDASVAIGAVVLVSNPDGRKKERGEDVESQR